MKMDSTRRGFLGMLAAWTSAVGAFLAWDWNRTFGGKETAFSDGLYPGLEIVTTPIPLLHAYDPKSESVIRWISVEDRLPELDLDWNEWSDRDEQGHRELIKIGKMSQRVLVSHGRYSDFGLYTQSDGDSPDWVIPDRYGTKWQAAITHWAHLPTPQESTQPQRDSAWKKLRDDHIKFRYERPPDDEQYHSWGVSFHPIKTKLPPASLSIPMLLSEPNRTYIGVFSERTKETTHWALLPVLRPSAPKS